MPTETPTAMFEGKHAAYHVVEAGKPDGPALLLLAGLASDHRSWGPVLALLGQGYRLVMPDNQGCGQTVLHPGKGIDLSAMVDDYAHLIDHYTDGSALVLGHSLGASLAMELAARFPARVSRLVIAGGAASMPAPMRQALTDLASLRRVLADAGEETLWYRILFQWLFAPKFFDDSRAVLAAAQMATAMEHSQTAADFCAQVEALFAGTLTAEPGAVTCPALVIHGGQDRFFAGTKGAHDLIAIPSVQVVTLDEAAHSLHWDEPEEFARAVLAFLNAA
ncbi:MAG: alpha/beta hydrolase [Pseudomonadota bacterium]